MSGTKRTPGTWEISSEHVAPYIITPYLGRGVIASCDNREDATLISRAPELLSENARLREALVAMFLTALKVDDAAWVSAIDRAGTTRPCDAAMRALAASLECEETSQAIRAALKVRS